MVVTVTLVDVDDLRMRLNGPRINGMLVSENKTFLKILMKTEELSQIQLPFNQIFFKRADTFGLSARTANCFISENIIYIGDLLLNRG